MVTNEDRELMEAFFRGMCYDMKDSPAYKGSTDELSAVNMDAGVYASNETNQMWYKEFADDFCDFVDDAFKTSGVNLGGDTYVALDAGSGSETGVPSGDDIDATINIDIDIRLNYPEETDADALMC